MNFPYAFNDFDIEETSDTETEVSALVKRAIAMSSEAESEESEPTFYTLYKQF